MPHPETDHETTDWFALTCVALISALIGAMLALSFVPTEVML